MYLIITSKDRNLVKMLMIPTQVVIFNLYRPQSLKYFNILFLEIFFYPLHILTRIFIVQY